MQTKYLVLGAGLAGAATAWRLAQHGEEVVLAEATTPANAGGSSHGSARIFRHAYPDEFHSALTVRALDGWRELEAASGEAILTITGGLDFGDGRDLDGIVASLTRLGLDNERLSAGAAMERWPQHRFDGDVVHHAGAGVIDAERAVLTMVEQARLAGAQVLTGWAAAAIRECPTGQVVTSTDGQEIDCAVLIVSAGAWLPELLDVLPGEWAARLPPLVVTQQQAFHFAFPESVGDPTDWPIFVNKDRLSVYSLPGGRDAGFRGFKIAEHDFGLPTTASGRDGLVRREARERIIDYVRRQLPDVEPVPYAETTCLYTSTPTENFVIDRIGSIVVASPCSGHGAKFAPLLGELIADVATGTADAPDLFRLPAHAA
ncbi:FAD-dependent oxidoreductase [Amnibacterium flavum]|uniref:Sarcosine oxidase n=1 Tax=Amnibacterium flavum TaxID=2173173 RepID=A0A2V1HRS0_9MICO|nr:FAD-dependent oxidoreductase [Amnibacterium flavum]PVZ95316.1 sarcosine oxidase [Amnibacterium flavum]